MTKSVSDEIFYRSEPVGRCQLPRTSLQMTERHHGKYIPDRGLDPGIIEALERRDTGEAEPQSLP